MTVDSLCLLCVIYSSCLLCLVLWLEWLQRTAASQWLHLTASHTWRLLIIDLLPWLLHPLVVSIGPWSPGIRIVSFGI